MMNENSGGNTGTPQIMVTKLSADTFTNATSQHATEVEPSLYANGSTILTAFQIGRIFGGGASDIGYAISTNGGASWSNGILPGITTFAGGSYSAVSDPAITFDKAHSQWVLASLAIGSTVQVVVSRSTDGQNWGNPILVSSTANADKEWIACDNNSGSQFFGHCYMEWDDPDRNGLIWMSTSTDGGLTWSAETNTSGSGEGVGGQPVVQPNGTVIVPILNADTTKILAFASTDGGITWSAPVTVASVTDHQVAGGLRTTALPSASIDASGTVYAVWQDCRFRTSCASNDMVLSTSQDGTTWTSPIRIPIDAVGSAVDHFIPGLGVDPATSGSSARLGLTYYYYPQSGCTVATCQLNVGFISSQDGGNSWTTSTAVAGPMSLNWLPNTSSGSMVGDYVATGYSGGKAYAVFAVAQANSGTVLDEAIYTNTGSLISARRTPAGTRDRVVSRHSDHAATRFEDVDQGLLHKTSPPN
jgi:hypothetical protein